MNRPDNARPVGPAASHRITPLSHCPLSTRIVAVSDSRRSHGEALSTRRTTGTPTRRSAGTRSDAAGPRPPEAPQAVLLVVLVVALEPLDVAVALVGQHVGGDAVEEPAVVGDHDFTNAGGAQDRQCISRAPISNSMSMDPKIQAICPDPGIRPVTGQIRLIRSLLVRIVLRSGGE